MNQKKYHFNRQVNDSQKACVTGHNCFILFGRFLLVKAKMDSKQPVQEMQLSPPLNKHLSYISSLYTAISLV